ncbi:MAG: replication-associated recombination protein A, partial [Chitinophagales bacterium]
TALQKAKATVRQTGDLSVPLHLRNAPTAIMKELNYGRNYKYAHDFQDNFIDQEFLPEAIAGNTFYLPGKNPREEEINNFLRKRWKGKYGY